MLNDGTRGGSEGKDWIKIVDSSPSGLWLIGLMFFLVPTLVVFASGKPLHETTVWREPALQVFVLFFYLIGVVILSIWVVLLRRKLRLDRAARETVGKIVEAARTRNWNWMLTIEWAADGEKRTRRLLRTWRLPADIDPQLDLKGVEVALQYDPENPKNCRGRAIRL